jgi:hypothetical protein
VPSLVNQSHANAQGGDIVAGHKTENHYHYAQSGVVGQLLEKLQIELDQSAQTRDTIERLQRFYKGRARDGIVGLEAKLVAAGRKDEYESALELKEMFAKLLEQWSLYASAQQIFVHLLARAEHQFRYEIEPQLGALSVVQINKLTTELIVNPTVHDCGSSIFEIDHNVAMGMVYWLAEQCFVRWHQ